MLNLARRERAHGSCHRDLGEAGTGFRSPDVPALLRRRRATQAAEPTKTENVGRNRLGEFGQTSGVPPQIDKMLEQSRRNGPEASDGAGAKVGW